MEAAEARFGGESPATADGLSEEEAESLALAIRLQQEEDDAALRAVSALPWAPQTVQTVFCWARFL
jgi:hypothetical protein